MKTDGRGSRVKCQFVAFEVIFRGIYPRLVGIDLSSGVFAENSIFLTARKSGGAQEERASLWLKKV